MQLSERTLHRYLIAGIILVHIFGLFVDIMDIDASQYASISLEMLRDGHWLQVHHRHADYLDKPPLLFWLSAISFKLFGVSNFSYKLPSFLFAMLGIYSTYRLTRLYYGRRAGRIAAIILGSVQALFSITMDVRTDTILMGAVIYAIWQLAEYLHAPYGKYLFGGFFGIGLAMLAKGPIGLMVPVIAIGTHLLLTGEWRSLFKWQWLVGVGIVALMLLPMAYGLYEQFDKHPEKTINGRTGVSGLYFYFWEQSFGRITGENVWHDDSGPLYFVHTTLWAFLPWTLILILALWDRFRFFRKEKYPEYLSIGGFVIPFIVLSMSHFKLPHYIYVVFPLGAMLSAAYYDKIGSLAAKRLSIAQYFILFGLWMLGFMLMFYIFTPVKWGAVTLSIAVFVLFILSLFKLERAKALLIATALTAIGTNVILSLQAYPNLLQYQSTSLAGRWLKNHPQEAANFAALGAHMHALDFYSHRIVPIRAHAWDVQNSDLYLYTDDSGIKELKEAGIPFIILRKYEDYPVTRLTPKFLNPETRPQAVRKRYLIRIYPEKK